MKSHLAADRIADRYQNYSYGFPSLFTSPQHQEIVGGNMTLEKSEIGRSRKIKSVGGSGALRRRLLDMGITPRTVIKVVKIAPMGDPIVLSLRGYELTLRKEDARQIQLEDEQL